MLIECACGRIWLATKTLLLNAGLLAKFPIAELPLRLHCPQCNKRGGATVLVKWAEAAS